MLCATTHKSPQQAPFSSSHSVRRYYVEDHGNQLVRTFTGNLTKMLSAAGTGFRRSSGGGGGGAHPLSSAPVCREGKAATDGGAAAQLQADVQSVVSDWAANRLMQTFSGPVRRRLGSRGWGPGSDRSVSDEATEEAVTNKSRLGGGRSDQVGRRDTASMQRAVDRIDEGEPAEETHE